ncbi:Uncharacterized protein BN871_DJ_00080 [Paenibacillus sp. P22]|nr:Uncharacterized protein BN871_DJ_00080 [Paenibacillus sp. P22]
MYTPFNIGTRFWLKPFVVVMQAVLGEEFVPEIKQPVLHDRLAHAAHHLQQEMQVMVGRQPDAERLVGLDEMPQISAGIIAAGVAAAFRIKRSEVLRVLGIADVHPSSARHRRAVAGNAGRKHAVEHVDSANRSFEKRVGRSDAHQITRLACRQERNRLLQHLIHEMLRFPDAQTTNSIPREIHGSQIRRALLAQVGMHASLDDREQPLVLRTGMGFEAALRPAGRPLERVFDVFVFGRIRRALVERHHDIGAERVLDLHRLLRRQEQAVAVEMGAEFDAFLGDLAHVAQREHLEAAAVRQNRAVPIHELVQAAGIADQVVARTEPQVIGVAENDMGVHFLELFRAHRLDGSLGADGHERRRLDDAVRGMDAAEPRPGLLAYFDQFVSYSHSSLFHS